MHLMATSLPVDKSLAMKTIPKEPWFRGEIVSNLPSKILPDSKPLRMQSIDDVVWGCDS